MKKGFCQWSRNDSTVTYRFISVTFHIKYTKFVAAINVPYSNKDDNDRTMYSITLSGMQAGLQMGGHVWYSIGV